MILQLTIDNEHAIRGTVLPDGTRRFSVLDFLTILCLCNEEDNTEGKKRAAANARKWFSRLVSSGSDHCEEITSNVLNMKFPGSGQRDTPTMTLAGLQKLFLLLGGKVAGKFRELLSDTFRRVEAGDKTLIQVIEANAASSAPVQQAYRASLAEEPAAPVLDEMCLKRKRELEDLEIAERLEKLEQSKESRRTNAIKSTQEVLGLIGGLDPQGIDLRTKLQAVDFLKNIMFTGSNNNLVTNGKESVSNENTGISVAVTASQMGFKCSPAQLQKIGRKMAEKYRETYGEEPTKHTQYVNGNCVPVNSYMERDRALLEACIREIML